MTNALIEDLAKLKRGQFTEDKSYARAADGRVYRAFGDIYEPGRTREVGERGVLTLCGGCAFSEPSACGAKGFRCDNRGRWKRVDDIVYANGLTVSI